MPAPAARLKRKSTFQPCPLPQCHYEHLFSHEHLLSLDKLVLFFSTYPPMPLDRIITATSVDLTDSFSSSSSSEASFYSCSRSLTGEMAQRSNHNLGSPVETKHESAPTDEIETGTGTTGIMTEELRVEGAADKVNTALQATQADWKKREVRT